MDDFKTLVYDIEGIGNISAIVTSSIVDDLKELVFFSYNEYFISNKVDEYKLQIISVFFPELVRKFPKGIPDYLVHDIYSNLDNDFTFLKIGPKGELLEPLTEEEIDNLANYEGEILITEKTGKDPKPIPVLKIAKVFGKEDYVRLEKELRTSVIGQDEAITEVLKLAKLSAAGLKNHSAILFAGPTGVGKTLLARALGKVYSGRFALFNCAEYSKSHEYSKLIGSPRGYIESDKKGILAEKAEKGNDWVFLFDEVEKAHPQFFEFLLALLDTGKLQDNQGKTLDFTKSIFIFTSNLGYKFEEGRVSMGFDKTVSVNKPTKQEVTKAIKYNFSPEFINRLASIVCFNSLSKESILSIVKNELQKLPIKHSKKLIELIADKGYSEAYGAREILRTIDSELKLLIADALMDRGEVYTDSMNKIFKAKIKNNIISLEAV